MARKVAVTGRVAPATKKAIEELAEKDGRSLGQYVERVLLAHLKSRKSERSRRSSSDD